MAVCCNMIFEMDVTVVDTFPTFMFAIHVGQLYVFNISFM